MPDDPTGRCPSELELDRWALDGRPTRHAVPAHAAGCEACRARLAALEDARALVAPAAFAANVQDVLDRAAARRAARSPWAWMTGAWARAALVPAAALGLALVALTLYEAPPPDPGALGWKAGAPVVLQVLAGGQEAGSGVTLAPGVVLTMRAAVQRPGFLAIVSVEEDGRVSRVLPARGATPTPVSPGVINAQGGVTASTGIERVLVLYDEARFDLDEALRALPSAGHAPEPPVTGGGGPRVAATWWFRHGGGPR